MSSIIWCVYLLYIVFLADTTGEYSVFTEYENSEVMFHISTLLPFTPANKQQVWMDMWIDRRIDDYR